MCIPFHWNNYIIYANIYIFYSLGRHFEIGCSSGLFNWNIWIPQDDSLSDILFPFPFWFIRVYYKRDSPRKTFLFFKAIILILPLGCTFKYARVFSVKLGKQQKHDSSVSALKYQAEKQTLRGRLACLASPRLKCTLRRPAQSRRTEPHRRPTNEGCPFIKPSLCFYV